MLSPHELKKTDFTRVMRGYNASEVDEHLNFVIEKYTELYRQNDELEQRLRTVTAQFEVLKKDEEAIRGALINAQRAGSAIVSEANERADVVKMASKTNCDKILSDFRAAIRYERAQLIALRETVSRFKAQLFSIYQEHIEQIASIPTQAQEVPAEVPTEDEMVRAAVDAIKLDITDLLENGPKKAETAEAAAQQTPADDTAPADAESEEDLAVNGRRSAPESFYGEGESKTDGEEGGEEIPLTQEELQALCATEKTEPEAEDAENAEDTQDAPQKEEGIMASLQRVNDQAQKTAPSASGRRGRHVEDDTYDRDLQEFMDDMNSRNG